MSKGTSSTSSITIRPVFRTAPILTLALACAAILFSPRAARAQGLGPGVAGAVGGAVAGSVVTAGWLALRATQGSYVWHPRELVGPVLISPLAGLSLGAFQGTTDSNELWASMGAGAVGGVLGAGTGYLLGSVLSSEDRSRWQGLLIGGAAGVVVGWAAGALLRDDDGGGAPAAPSVVFRIPLGGGG